MRAGDWTASNPVARRRASSSHSTPAIRGNEWAAITGNYAGDMVRDVMLQAVKNGKEFTVS